MSSSSTVTSVLRETALGRPPDRKGKVRDIYELGDRLMIVSTDRISAFDMVLPGGIPHKGRVLTTISEFWFEKFSGQVKHHLDYVVGEQVPEEFADHREQLRNRAMVCRTCEVVPIECVVRGYLAGSGWKDYQRTGSVCGVKLPSGLRQSDRLPEPAFTHPTTHPRLLRQGPWSAQGASPSWHRPGSRARCSWTPCPLPGHSEGLWP